MPLSCCILPAPQKPTWAHLSFFFCKFIYFKLEDNCFTILYWFLPYINTIHVIGPPETCFYEDKTSAPSQHLRCPQSLILPLPWEPSSSSPIHTLTLYHIHQFTWRPYLHGQNSWRWGWGLAPRHLWLGLGSETGRLAQAVEIFRSIRGHWLSYFFCMCFEKHWSREIVMTL